MALKLTDIFKEDKDDQEIGFEGESLLQSAVDADDSSLMTSSLDSQLSSHLDAAYAQPAASDEPTVTLPILGARTLGEHQRILFFLLILALLATAAGVFWVITQSGKTTGQLEVVSHAQMQAQRMAKSSIQALAGNEAAFGELSESSGALANAVHSLRDGGPGVGNRTILALGDSFTDKMESVVELVTRDNKGAEAIVGQQQALTSMGAVLGDARRHAGDGAYAEVDVANRLAALSQSIVRSGGDAAKRLGDDLRALPDALKEAVNAQETIVRDSKPLSEALQALESELQKSSGLGITDMLAFLVAAALAMLAVAGLTYIPLLDSRQRQAVAEQQRSVAETLQQESKRVNDANQAAILRLMNELQVIAEGDLTQEATVTEDITGAIADSVNYTVEELRNLVGNVQNTADSVVQTTSKVEVTSSNLLEASSEQRGEIRKTSESVLDMAAHINEISAQAQESADVAEQSLKAATRGRDAVQSTNDGMNVIRDQIQETSKRIKRLGESSQEIGEITELIADITEQTNVLALNAAIQAASAGEAGRGFSVVAEEVQRLAERSGDATRQIAALVKAIQTDTQDAVAAMERSTHGVVEGARLSENAGTALTEIDRVTRRLAELVEKISDTAQKEAAKASGVADDIKHILEVTEQAEEGTQNTAKEVRELARIANDLRQSVSRFKISA